MVARPVARKTTTARKSAAAKPAAAPVRKAAVKPAPAARKAATPAPKATAKAPAAKKPVAEKLTAYDVYRAEAAVRVAQENYEKVRAAYEAQGGEEIKAAVAHAENFVDVATPPKREGRKPLETPSAKARAKEPVIGEFYDQAKTSAMPIKELRALAEELAAEGLITETMKKAVILQQMEDAGLFRSEGNSGSDEDDELSDDEDFEEDEEAEDEDEEYDEDDDESEDSDDDSDEDDEEGYTLEDLKAMKLAELQELAEQNEIDVDGMSKSQIILALVGDDEEDEEEDEEEPEDEDYEEEEEEDDDVQTISIDELPNLSVAELLTIAKDAGVKVPVAKKKDKKFLIAMIKKAVGDAEE